MTKSKKKFIKQDYDNEYRKTHYKQFKVNLSIEEFNNLEILLNKNNLTKIQFVRNSMKELEKK